MGLHIFLFKKAELFWLEELSLACVLLVHHQALAGEGEKNFWPPDTHL